MKNKIIEIGKNLKDKGFEPGISGNISLRAENGFYITATGAKLSALQEYDIVLLDYNCNLLEGTKKPSSEKKLHNEIYKLRKDVNAIIHCHSPKCATLSVCHIPMNKKLLADCVFYFKEIPLAPYGMPSSDKFVEKTVPYFKEYNAVLLANHGLVVAADTIENAFYLTETAEFNAEVYINSMMLKMSKSLSESAVAEINALRNNK